MCGEQADTGEHKIKKYLLNKEYRQYFLDKGMLHFKNGSWTKIQGSNSKKLKYQNTLCATCNNSKTKKYDLAYDKFVDYVLANKTIIAEKQTIDLTEIYKDNYQEKWNLFKYFVKIFGCDLVDSKCIVPLDLVELLNNKETNIKFYICFSVFYDGIGATGIGELLTNDSKTTFSFSSYFGNLNINYYYGWLPEEQIGNNWQPENNLIKLNTISFVDAHYKALAHLIE